jgi:cytochrome P450
MTNFGAGVETIAITVSSLVIAIISHEGYQERIQAEIDAARQAGKLT